MQAEKTIPYRNESMSKIYELLFCDRPELFRVAGQEELAYPWDVLFGRQQDAEKLKALAADQHLETRVRIIANQLLREQGETIADQELLGVIVEVGMEEGLDTLAAYKDGTARYINHSENIIFWDAPTDASEGIIQRLFQHSEAVVKKIGPWDKERLAAPKQDDIRLSFLVSDGLYFGQGSFSVLSRDPMAAPVIQSATELLTFLIGQK